MAELKHWMLVLTLALSLGCSTLSYDLGDPVSDKAKTQELLAHFSDELPAQFRAVHRTVLTVRKRQFNLNGYLRADRSEGFRLLTTTGFNTTMFEVAGRATGESFVLQSSDMLSDDILRDGPAEDMRNLFFRHPSEEAQLTSPARDSWALVDEARGGMKRAYIFDRATGRLLQQVLLKNSRIQYRVDFEYSHSEEGKLPSRIRIHNTPLKYDLDVRIIQFSEDQFDPATLFGNLQP